jgi:hypothetical protein
MASLARLCGRPLPIAVLQRARSLLHPSRPLRVVGALLARGLVTPPAQPGAAGAEGQTHCNSTTATCTPSQPAPPPSLAALPTSDESDELLRIRHSVSSCRGGLDDGGRRRRLPLHCRRRRPQLTQK